MRSADVFLDIGNHGAWMDDAVDAGARVLIDGEPGYRQMKMQEDINAGRLQDDYDLYFTNGLNIGTPAGRAPSAGRRWFPIPNPVDTDTYLPATAPPAEAPFTTVMNWQSHAPLEFEGEVYGQKDVEFEKFMDLPTRTGATLEISLWQVLGLLANDSPGLVGESGMYSDVPGIATTTNDQDFHAAGMRIKRLQECLRCNEQWMDSAIEAPPT